MEGFKSVSKQNKTKQSPLIIGVHSFCNTSYLPHVNFSYFPEFLLNCVFCKSCLKLLYSASLKNELEFLKLSNAYYSISKFDLWHVTEKMFGILSRSCWKIICNKEIGIGKGLLRMLRHSPVQTLIKFLGYKCFLVFSFVMNSSSSYFL